MEVVSLQQAAKASAVGAKGGATTAERLKKELEKTRCVHHRAYNEAFA
jgi:hypothetical protein